MQFGKLPQTTHNLEGKGHSSIYPTVMLWPASKSRVQERTAFCQNVGSQIGELAFHSLPMYISGHKKENMSNLGSQKGELSQI